MNTPSGHAAIACLASNLDQNTVDATPAIGENPLVFAGGYRFSRPIEVSPGQDISLSMSVPGELVRQLRRSEVRSAFGHRSAPVTMTMDMVGENGEKGFIIPLETPYKVFAIPERRPKAVLERLQLERFRLDYLARTGSLPFDEVAAGSDPPDFVVRLLNGTEENVDCAALTIGDRRMAYQLWSAFRRRLEAEASSHDFGALASTEITVWFGNGGALPPKRSGEEVLSGLVRLLRDFDFDRKKVQELTVSGKPLVPDEHNSATLKSGAAGFYVSVVPFGRLQTPFAQKLGFECSLSFVQHIMASDVTRELGRVIRQHDKEPIDHLIISAGGPDRDNVQYPADDIQLDILPDREYEFKHLRRVTLHRWLTGQWVELRRA